MVKMAYVLMTNMTIYHTLPYDLQIDTGDIYHNLP